MDVPTKVISVEKRVVRAETWIKQHERLVLAVIAGLALWFAIGKIDALIANHDHANLEQAKVAAAVQQEKNEALAKQMAQHDADVEALAAKVEARDAQLTQLQAQLVTALTKQQAADRTMSQPELATRWLQLVPEADPLTLDPKGGLRVSTEGARATVIELEKAPVLQKQLDAKAEQLTNAQAMLTAEGQQVLDRDGLITGLKKQAVLDAGVCQDTIKTVKDDARKSKRKWFLWGFVAGFVSRQAIKSYTGF
jgi:2',3'-cyclic-nucleotide 2'-phosphodiesterase (5'-nucleotidase family)